MGVLSTFGISALLIAIAEISEEGVTTAAVTAAIGAALVTAGYGAKRMLLP